MNAEAAAPASPRTRRLRTIAVALLVLAGFVNYIDRAAVAIGNPEIRHDLGLSYAQMGLLLSAFAWAYGAAQIPAGALVDRFGPRRVLGIGLMLWSVAQLGAGVVGSFGQFIAARLGLGLGESPMYIGGTLVCAEWYPLKRRALPIAIFNSSSALAPALAPPLLTLLMLAFGWRAMFLIAGVAGFLVAALWIGVYRGPRDAGVSEAEIAAIHGDDPPLDAGAAEGGKLRRLLRFRATYGMFLGFFGVVYVSWLYATWLPGYLEAARHEALADAGFWSAVPLAAGFVGAVAGGVISEKLGRMGVSAANACRAPTIAGLIGAGIFTIAGAYVPSTGLAIALMAVGLFAANVASSCGWALPAVIAPPDSVATLEAVQNVGGSLGGALAPLLSGILVQMTGSFVPAFGLAGGVAFACAAVYWLMT